MSEPLNILIKSSADSTAIVKLQESFAAVVQEFHRVETAASEMSTTIRASTESSGVTMLVSKMAQLTVETKRTIETERVLAEFRQRTSLMVRESRMAEVTAHRATLVAAETSASGAKNAASEWSKLKSELGKKFSVSLPEIGMHLLGKAGIGGLLQAVDTGISLVMAAWEKSEAAAKRAKELVKENADLEQQLREVKGGEAEVAFNIMAKARESDKAYIELVNRFTKEYQLPPPDITNFYRSNDAPLVSRLDNEDRELFEKVRKAMLEGQIAMAKLDKAGEARVNAPLETLKQQAEGYKLQIDAAKYERSSSKEKLRILDAEQRAAEKQREDDIGWARAGNDSKAEKAADLKFQARLSAINSKRQQIDNERAAKRRENEVNSTRQAIAAAKAEKDAADKDIERRREALEDSGKDENAIWQERLALTAESVKVAEKYNVTVTALPRRAKNQEASKVLDDAIGGSVAAVEEAERKQRKEQRDFRSRNTQDALKAAITDYEATRSRIAKDLEGLEASELNEQERWNARRALHEQAVTAAREYLAVVRQIELVADSQDGKKAAVQAVSAGQKELDTKSETLSATLADKPKDAPARSLSQEVDAQFAQLRSGFQTAAGVVTNTFKAAIDSTAQSIQGLLQGTLTWGAALRNIGGSILNSVVSGISRMFAEWIIGIGKRAIAEKAAAAVEFVAKLPGAILTSITSFGTAAAIGVAGVVAALALAKGFSSGGYTGPGGVNDPAGVVHRGEVVFSQRDVSRLGGVAAVESLRVGGGYALSSGGFASSATQGGPALGNASSPMNIAYFNTRQDAENWLQSQRGRRVMIDWIRENQYEL